MSAQSVHSMASREAIADQQQDAAKGKPPVRKRWIYIPIFGLVVGMCVLAVSMVIGWLDEEFPMAKAENCKHQKMRSNMTKLDGLKYKCGWQELRPGDTKARLFAYIQPGSWCWNNAGLVAPISGGLGGGLLIDTLMDEVLTADMIKKRDRVGGWSAMDFQALFFTHPDTDHFLGQWSIGKKVRRFGRPEVDDEMMKMRTSKHMIVAASNVGHYLYSIAERCNFRDWVRKVPEGTLRETVITVLGWAWFQSKVLSQFNLYEVNVNKLVPIADEGFFYKDEQVIPGIHGMGKIVVRNYGAIHSSSDSMVFLPDSKVVYTGDLLFIGIAPAMWAGPAKRWVNALTKLLAQTEDKEAGWLYVPGHGHVTDADGVRMVRKYFEYLDKAVEEKCDWKEKEKDSECAQKLLKGLPSDLRRNFAEPQRILINAVVECMARRNKGPVKIELLAKVKLLTSQGEYAIRDMLDMQIN